MPMLYNEDGNILDTPLILLGKGGGGTRLLSLMAEDCGVCVGAHVNVSGDCLDMEQPIKTAMTHKLLDHSTYDREAAIHSLRHAAGSMLQELSPEQRIHWGFKLPESLFILPELAEAFPMARFAVMFRDPVLTSLRRTHLTSRLDNPVGRITLPAAYEHAGADIDRIPHDHQILHNAYAIRHQLDLLLDFMAAGGISASRFFTCRFEEVVASPEKVLKEFSPWLGLAATGSRLLGSVDKDRSKVTISAEEKIIAEVREILSEVMQKTGYEG